MIDQSVLYNEINDFLKDSIELYDAQLILENENLVQDTVNDYGLFEIYVEDISFYFGREREAKKDPENTIKKFMMLEDPKQQ